MMRYVGCVLAIAAAVAYARTLTAAEIARFIDYHNRARDNVTKDYPNLAPATCIPHVQWDDWLAEHAQNYSNTCASGHSQDKYKNGEAMGENLAWSWSTGYIDAIGVANMGWYNEYKDYGFEEIGYSGYPTGVKVGHYTQMVWDSTLYIGCGWRDDCTGSYTNMITCNYYPAGNWRGNKPWTPRGSGVPLPVCPEPGSSSTPSTQECTSGECCDTTTHTFRPASYECRAKTGDCDIAAHCTGTSASCPANTYEPNGTVCAASGLCETDGYCNGRSAKCQGKKTRDSTYVCRPAAGLCDVEEKCTGRSVECPVDKYLPNTTVCSEGYTCSGDSAYCPNEKLPFLSFSSAPMSGGCCVFSLLVMMLALLLF